MKKNSIFSAICFLLALLTVVSFAGCAKDETPSFGSFTNSPTTTAQPSPKEDPPAVNDLPAGAFTFEHLAQAQIVVPTGSMILSEDGYIYSVLSVLQNLIKSKFDINIPIKQDIAQETTYEILVGDTNRAESRQIFSDLLLSDYGYAVVGTKIVINGGDDAALRTAVNEFTNLVTGTRPGGKKWFYAPQLDTVVRKNYPGQNATLNGELLSSYSIVYPNDSTMYELEFAERLAHSITMLTGHETAFYSDATPYTDGAYEILLGKTNRAFSYQTVAGAALESGGHFVAITGDNAYQYGLSQDALVDALNNGIIKQSGTITVAAQKEVIDTPDVSVMGYNIYGVTEAVYQERANNVCRLVTRYLPDIVAFQEPASNLMDMIHMEEYYGYYMGIPRHGADVPAIAPGWPGANSYGPILYAKERYEVVEGGTKWMSETPDVVSKIDGSDFYRFYTYVLFHDKLTDEQFIVVNHHLDFDASVQVTTMKYMYKFFNENYTDIPVIMAGDMNAGSGSDVINMVLSEASGFESLHTMCGPSVGDAKVGIDWIFATPCCVNGVYFTVCRDTYPDQTKAEFDNRMPSDHPATFAKLLINSKSGCTHNWSGVATWTP